MNASNKNVKQDKESKDMKYHENKPISAWGYIGYDFVFAIPVIGIIIALILALGATNRNVKNFARSQFCFILILVIAYGIAAAIGLSAN